ncbi:hypothetical protein EJ04DRAFT_469312 [Polyplosphaeria fusca]|uniref:Splicing factor Cactin n=1 Tax=Polyplosphaeria fusca TaxID=682080 RepID=A0A9P4V186_9PLEO|nr:hypothetical protein EJ04DRAFT_469312 [Polyplosphaeria fusca]
MSSRNAPPWLKNRDQQPSSSTVPAKRGAKRGATPPSHDRPTKRSTNEQEEAWIADEDHFVLQQAKKKSAIRVKNDRAQPIDWLAVTLRFVDPTRNPLDTEIEDHELEVMDPEGVFEDLTQDDLAQLEKEIDNYLVLETDRGNREYWTAAKAVCKDRRRQFKPPTADARTFNNVADDIERLLAPKTYEQLRTLEGQVKNKLDSDEPMDYDYWEQLLRDIRVRMAKAKLRMVTEEVLKERLQKLRQEQLKAAESVQDKIRTLLGLSEDSADIVPSSVAYTEESDPEPALRLRPEDKVLGVTDDRKILGDIVRARRKVVKLGYVPMRKKVQQESAFQSAATMALPASTGLSRFAPVDNEDLSQATAAMYEREVARGVNEDEEIFTNEENVTKAAKPKWADQYKPRKPRYFNRVQMGYEWNKYNQTHYDHDNPPPKVVQGYKFNIFYPDLVDKASTPTFKIERENGRKRGQSFAPAGEDDTCLIHFIAGPPYEDIAFRIVDKEWDYSGKHERGYKSTFDKGMLQLHFNFKKVYYRK